MKKKAYRSIAHTSLRDKSVSQFSFLRLAPYDENLSDRNFDCIARMFDSRADIAYESDLAHWRTKNRKCL